MSNRAEKLLVDLMEKGYSLSIEAKGRGREFEMSYEVHTLTINLEYPVPLIAFGETLEDALESIQRQIDLLQAY